MRKPHLTQKKFRKKLVKMGLMNFWIERAIGIVEKYFAHKKRDDGSSFLEQHIYPVAYETAVFFEKAATADVIIAALFHDLFEDTDYSDLARDFPSLHKEILRDTMPLTKGRETDRMTYEQKMEYNKKYFRGLYRATHVSRIIKLLDRINNLSCGAKGPKREFYLLETREFYLPFARSTDRLLYERMLKAYEKLGGKRTMLGFGKKGVKFKVHEIGIHSKERNRPASLYFRLGLACQGPDKFRIKDRVIELNLTLQDVMALHLDSTITELASKLLEVPDSPYEHWEKIAADLTNRLDKKLMNKTLTLGME